MMVVGTIAHGRGQQLAHLQGKLIWCTIILFMRLIHVQYSMVLFFHVF